jgi:PAS domain S-box-containing protein
MTRTEIDYRAAFRDLPGAIALLTPDLVIRDANRDFLDLTGRNREDLLGRPIFEAFPANPAMHEHDPQRSLRSSLETVLATGMRDAMGTTRYDLEVQDHPGEFEERYWAVTNGPVLSSDGEVVLIINRAEEITHIIRQVLKAQPRHRLRGMRG